MQSKGTWVTLFFVFAALLVAFILNLALGDLFTLLRVENSPILGEKFRLSAACAVAIAGLAAVYAGIVNRSSSLFVEQAIVELNKSAWPTLSETRMSTFIVVMFSFVASIILGVFDAVFAWLTNINLYLGQSL